MLKINKSILIICIVSLFLIIGQISASDTDLMQNNDSNTDSASIESDNLYSDAPDLDRNVEEELNESTRLDKISTPIENSDEEPRDTIGIVMANDNYRCGPASLATALNRFGLNLSLNEVSLHTNTSLNGTSMQSLIDASRYYKFSAYGVEIDTKDLKENYIVHLNINGSMHWTVINNVTDSHVLIADSTEGNINFTMDDFNSYFTGKAIVISKNSSTDLKEQIISNRIKVLDRKQCKNISGKGLKRKVIGYRIVWKYGFIRKYGWVLRPRVVGGHICFSQWQYVKGYYSVWGKYKAKEPIYKYYYVSDDALTSAKLKKTKR